MFESRKAATIDDIAAMNVTARLASRIILLAYLSPDVLEGLLLWWERPSATITQMTEATHLPWAEQVGRVFEA